MQIRSFIVIAAGLMCFISISVQGFETTPSTEFYEGEIVYASPCALAADDRRACYDLAVRFDDGSVVEVSLWGGATGIYDNRGNVIYKVDHLDCSADMRNKFYTAVGYLTEGSTVSMDVSCGADSGCSVISLCLQKKTPTETMR